MKKFAKFTVFIIILSLVTGIFYHLLSWKDTEGISKFYTYEEDTIDVAFAGSSHVFCSINTAQIWEDYGIASYTLAEGGQKLSNTYYYLKELYKTQHPKVVFVEAWATAVMDEGLEDGNLYRNTLNMNLSEDSIENTSESLKTSKVDESDYDDYLKYITLKFPVFHSNYSEIEEDDFYEYPSNGFYFESNWGNDYYETPYACSVTEASELSEYNTYWLNQIIDLIKENNSVPVLWVSPFVLSPEQMEIFNAVKQFAADNDVAYFNFNEIYEEIGFSYETDMREEGWTGSHVNNYGAEKISAYLADYALSISNLADHRGDEKYSVYDNNLELWNKEVNEHLLETTEDLSVYISLLNDSYEYSIIIYDKAYAFDGYFNDAEVNEALENDFYYFTCGKDINGSYRLSDSVVFTSDTGYPAGFRLYEDGIEQYIGISDLEITVVDKENGNLIDRASFVVDGDSVTRKS